MCYIPWTSGGQLSSPFPKILPKNEQDGMVKSKTQAKKTNKIATIVELSQEWSGTPPLEAKAAVLHILTWAQIPGNTMGLTFEWLELYEACS